VSFVGRVFIVVHVANRFFSVRFGGHYRSGAVRMIRTLLEKYGSQAKTEL
jgi:hypothetical protein